MIDFTGLYTPEELAARNERIAIVQDEWLPEPCAIWEWRDPMNEHMTRITPADAILQVWTAPIPKHAQDAITAAIESVRPSYHGPSYRDRVENGDTEAN